MADKTYKERGNYPTGGWCKKRKTCATFLLSSLPNPCEKCVLESLYVCYDEKNEE